MTTPSLRGANATKQSKLRGARVVWGFLYPKLNLESLKLSKLNLAYIWRMVMPGSGSLGLRHDLSTRKRRIGRERAKKEFDFFSP